MHTIRLLAFAPIAAFAAALSGPLPDPPPLLWSTQVGSRTSINAELAVVDLPTSTPSAVGASPAGTPARRMVADYTPTNSEEPGTAGDINDRVEQE
jgi:hypothetical protein